MSTSEFSKSPLSTKPNKQFADQIDANSHHWLEWLKWVQLFCVESEVLNNLRLKILKSIDEYLKNLTEGEPPPLVLTAEEMLEFEQSKSEGIAEIELAQKLNCKLVFFWQKGFPHNLKRSPYCPLALYFLGNYQASDSKAMALVGTRTPTPYGDFYTHQFARQIAEMGVCLVSGLAIGIDQRAHESCLENGGRTLAVLGHGIAPALRNKQVSPWLHRIAQHGAVISQFPLQFKATTFSFPMRNRIISGLSHGVILTESRRQGGAMITTKFALHEGKEIFALVGPIHSACSEGPNYWLSQGAQCLISESEFKGQIQSFLDRRFGIANLEKSQKSLRPQKPESLEAKPFKSLPTSQTSLLSNFPQAPSMAPAVDKIPAELLPLYDAIVKNPQSLDLLSQNLGWPTPKLQASLMRLEMGGWVECLRGGVYRPMGYSTFR